MNHKKHRWGHEIIWADQPQYSGRTLILTEGEQTSYAYSKKRDVTLFVLQGTVLLVVEGRKKVLNEQDSYHLSPKIMYRIIALKGDVTVLEVGTKLEDDIVVVEE